MSIDLDAIEQLVELHPNGTHAVFVGMKSEGAWTLNSTILKELIRLARLGQWTEEYGKFLLISAENLYRPDRPLYKHLDPTFYHTHTYEGDLELINKTKEARFKYQEINKNEAK